MVPSQNLVNAALAMSHDQVARLKNQQYVEGLKKAPAWSQPKEPYGMQKGSLAADPAKVLQADPRFSTGGPSAVLRPQPSKEDL